MFTANPIQQLIDSAGSSTFLGHPYGLGETAAHKAASPIINPLKTGKRTLLFTGASTSNQLAKQFITLIKNPNIIKVNACVGGKDVNDWINGSMWPNTDKVIADAGLRNSDIQMIWCMTSDSQATNTEFNAYTSGVKSKLKTLVTLYDQRFPKAKRIDFTCRHYADYIEQMVQYKEPKAYYDLWATKFLVEDWKAGLLPGIPYISDGFNMWTDGLKPRIDGAKLELNHLKQGGPHLSDAGIVYWAKFQYDYWKSIYPTWFY